MEACSWRNVLMARRWVSAIGGLIRSRRKSLQRRWSLAGIFQRWRIRFVNAALLPYAARLDDF
jgi:hypothetical protein